MIYQLYFLENLPQQGLVWTNFVSIPHLTQFTQTLKQNQSHSTMSGSGITIEVNAPSDSFELVVHNEAIGGMATPRGAEFTVGCSSGGFLLHRRWSPSSIIFVALEPQARAHHRSASFVCHAHWCNLGICSSKKNRSGTCGDGIYESLKRSHVYREEYWRIVFIIGCSEHLV